MKSRRIVLGCGIPAVIILALVAAIAYRALAPLRSSIPPHGQIVDATTGTPVAGAQIETSWQIYDYPMMDGHGSYEVSSTTVTDEKGHFSLVIPNHRQGIWKTATNPTIIRADGYKPFTFDDPCAVTGIYGKYITIRVTPRSSDTDKDVNTPLNKTFPGENVVR